VLGFQIQSATVFFPSALNPADDPTRQKQVRPPVDVPPPWWGPLCRGSTAALDRATELAGFGADSDHFDQNQLLELAGPHAFKPQAAFTEASLREPSEAPPVRLATVPAPRSCAPDLPLPTGPLSLMSDSARADLLVFPRHLFATKGLDFDLCAPGTLLLFGGRNGVARQLLRLGCPWVLCLEPNSGPERDPDDPACRSRLHRLVCAGAFLAVCAAPLASTMSRACCRVPRSAAHPEGLEHLSP